MGLLDRAITQWQVKPRPAAIGNWVKNMQTEIPLLALEKDLSALVAHRVLLSSPLVNVSASWSFKTEKRVNTLSTDRLVQAQLRSQVGGISYGAPGPGFFTSNWHVRVPKLDGSDNASGAVTVPSYRMINGNLPNESLFKQTVDDVLAVLATGPAGVEYREGRPEFTNLFVQETALSRNQTMLGDCYLPIPASFADGVSLPLDGTELDAVVKGIDELGLCGAGIPLRRISLAGGRAGSNAAIELRAEPFSLGLVLPEERPHDRQRTFHAALAVFRILHILIQEKAPASATVIQRFFADCTKHWDSERYERFVPVTSADSPSPVLPLATGARLPLGVHVVLSADESMVSTRYHQALYWLPRLDRQFRQHRRAPRYYLQNGPGKLPDTALFRYINSPEWSLGGWRNLKANNYNWFWQTQLTTARAQDGRTEARLTFRGLSRTNKLLCYASELAAFVDAFLWLLSDLDPSMQLHTLTMQV